MVLVFIQTHSFTIDTSEDGPYSLAGMYLHGAGLIAAVGVHSEIALQEQSVGPTHVSSASFREV